MSNERFVAIEEKLHEWIVYDNYLNGRVCAPKGNDIITAYQHARLIAKHLNEQDL